MTNALTRLRASVVVCVASTLAYLTLYGAARGAATPSIADAVALAVTAVAQNDVASAIAS